MNTLLITIVLDLLKGAPTVVAEVEAMITEAKTNDATAAKLKKELTDFGNILQALCSVL